MRKFVFCLANEDSDEHETSLKSLENRWQDLHQQILNYEKDIEQSIFNDELQQLTKVRNEFQVWLDAAPSPTFKSELQVRSNCN